jgi:hypothetical protein
MRLLPALAIAGLLGATDITITGLVIDTGCYISHNTKGPKHVPCATACAKAGVPLAILDESSGAVYLPVAVNHKNQNAILMPFIEKRVTVTGAAFEKGGMKGIGIRKVTEAK